MNQNFLKYTYSFMQKCYEDILKIHRDHVFCVIKILIFSLQNTFCFFFQWYNFFKTNRLIRIQ